MTVGHHRFCIGAFDCAVVSDGTFGYVHPDRLLFANAPRDELASALAEWNVDLSTWHTYESPYPSLLIETGDQRLLIDTGAGDWGPSTGQLTANLQALGVTPADIDVVVLTHAHPDHIGGALDSQGRPAFPNARYLISQAEWDFWRSDPDMSGLALPDEFKAALLACAEKNLPRLAEQIECIDADSEIVRGVRAIDAAGHTPGQIGVSIASGDQRFLAVADVVVHPVHLSHPEWCTAVDYTCGRTVDTRRRILSRAAAEEALVFAYHFPAPGLGLVRTNGPAWQWQPFVP